jgi:transcriptional regulator with XRE-family HTH domain
LIGDRLKVLREKKEMSQGDIEKKTGLLRCYISRVENGHTVPSVGTLEKLARAFGVPLYEVFRDDDSKAVPLKLGKREKAWGESGKDASTVRAFRQAMSEMSDRDRGTLIAVATKMARVKKA